MKLSLSISLCCALFAHVASSQDMYVNIDKIVTYSDGSLGNCAVKIRPLDSIATQAGYAVGTGAGQCSQGFISFDCNGTFIAKSDSARMFNTAQLAYATGKRAFISVDNTKKLNAVCTASRIDVLP